MANNPPDRRAPEEPVTCAAVSDPANAPASVQPEVVPVAENQSFPASEKSLEMNAANGGPSAANPVVVTVKLEEKSEPPPPPPSKSNALWLGLTLLNIVLVVFLVPSGLLKNDRVAFIVQIATTVAAAGAFAAGLVWFKNLATSLPKRRWFKGLNVVLLCTLIPANLSQMSVVPMHAQIESGTTLEIDDKRRDFDGGPVMLSINNHKIKVTPSLTDKGKEREYRVSFKEVIGAVFRGYRARWTPLYLVYINTEEPNVDVLIRKTDEAFDDEFRAQPEPTKRGYNFKAKAGAPDTFVYRGGPNETGSEDAVYLPYGKYKFVGSKSGCAEREIELNINKGEPEGYSVDFGFLCGTPQ